MREPERKAYVCRHKECVPMIRVFLLPGDTEPPRCPNGHGRMSRQANMKYPGKERLRAQSR